MQQLSGHGRPGPRKQASPSSHASRAAACAPPPQALPCSSPSPLLLPVPAGKGPHLTVVCRLPFTALCQDYKQERAHTGCRSAAPSQQLALIDTCRSDSPSWLESSKDHEGRSPTRAPIDSAAHLGAGSVQSPVQAGAAVVGAHGVEGAAGQRPYQQHLLLLLRHNLLSHHILPCALAGPPQGVCSSQALPRLKGHASQLSWRILRRQCTGNTHVQDRAAHLG